MEKILKARENRQNNLLKMMNNDSVYVILKANIPGEVKRTNVARFLVNLFRKRLNETFFVKRSRFFNDYDGFYDIYEINCDDIKNIKLLCVNIEDSAPLGRYIDIDVYQNSLKSISRSELGIDNRKCFLCDNDAHICARNQTHSYEELENKLIDDVVDYIYNETTNFIKESIELECGLYPKFGLVTMQNNGSHSDMNYDLMMKSKNVVAPYIAMMTISGFSNPEEKIFDDIREIGKLCEKRMFQATNGINTHKGLIFGMGFVAAAFGMLLKDDDFSYHKLQDTIKYLGRDLENDFLSEHDTFGYLAYKKYGFLGARGETMKGMPNAFLGVDVLDEYPALSKEALTMALVSIIRGLEDTVLLKRSGTLEKYNYFKNLVGTIDVYDEVIIEEVTKECVKNNISFGGAADILAISIFIKKMKEGFISYE